MRTMRARFPWLTIPWELQAEIEAAMPQFLLQEAAGKGEKRMRCTACGNAGIHTPVAKNHGAGLCPFCMEPIEVVDHLRYRGDDLKTLHRSTDVMIFRECGGELWGIDARATRWLHRDGYYNMDISTGLDFYVYSVYHFAPGTAEQWKWKMGYDGEEDKTWRYDWRKLETPTEPTNQKRLWGGAPEDYNLYGLEEALPKTSCRFCGIEEYFESIGDGESLRGVIRYLRAWVKRPKLELVVKWGLRDIAEDFVMDGRTWGREVNWKADTPWDFLKIKKPEWRLYRESRGACILLMERNRHSFHLPLRWVLDFFDRNPGYEALKLAGELHEKGVPIPQQEKYLKRQFPSMKYAQAARTVGRDVSPEGAIMPRNLQAAHDEAIELRRQWWGRRPDQRLTELEKSYGKRLRRLRAKYAYRSGDLEIRVPETAEEIIREGNVLRICVGGYAARHLNGATTILFLRHARRPERPYICIEIDEANETIRQIHGYGNENYLRNGKPGRTPMQKHGDFIREWLSWVKAGSCRGETKKMEESA